MAIEDRQPNLRQRKNSGAKDLGDEKDPMSQSNINKESEEAEPLLASASANGVGIDENERKGDPADGYVLIPLRERWMLERLDVAPFLLIYAALITWDQYCGPGDNANAIVSVALPAVLLAHLALFLVQQWNVEIRASVGFRALPIGSVSGEKHARPPLATASKIMEGYTRYHPCFSAWTHCLVHAPQTDQHQSSHNVGIVPICFQNDGCVAVVRFQDVLFRSSTFEDVDEVLWKNVLVSARTDESAKPIHFHRIIYPTHEPLSFYTNWTGHRTVSQVVSAQSAYGFNTTPIDLPPFLELLQEQLLAPFFLFQILCVLLWSLDEYWYYAIFTFFALLTFESTMAWNRLQSLKRLRSHTASDDGRSILVYRPGFPPASNNWISVRVTELVPGDIVSIKQPVKSRQKTANDARGGRIPADLVLLQGDAVVDEALLTGESIPQLKAALGTTTAFDDDNDRLDLQEHKQSILFGGTTLLVSHSGLSDAYSPSDSSSKTLPPPDQGAVCMVIRTGFETAQGSLLRTMAHTQKSLDGVHTTDTYVFILILLACAVASAYVVWSDGVGDPTRNQFRLTLHVIIIITSVVPPELPMELSLAVTNSVNDLVHRCRIYCTEVFRIPLAGQVEVCCFDKTGTLTSDEMLLVGVRLVDHANNFFIEQAARPDGANITVDSGENDDGGAFSIPWDVKRIMASCHSLALNDVGISQRPSSADAFANVVGDPLEKAVMKESGYRLFQNHAMRSIESAPPGQPNTILILHRFSFSSQLKRMSVIVCEEGSFNVAWILAKGAPETIKELLTPESIPADYDIVCKGHMSLGQRVLAIAYRKMVDMPSKSVKDLPRSTVERDLTFAGFLLLNCPIKPDSAPVIGELRKSGHHVVMITGDAILTAVEVARQVGIVERNKMFTSVSYQLRHTQSTELKSESIKGHSFSSDFCFVPLYEEHHDCDYPVKLPLNFVKQKHITELLLSGRMSLCVSGDDLNLLAKAIIWEGGRIENRKIDDKQMLMHPAVQTVLTKLVPYVSVFARHAPRQKEAIVAAFNAGGKCTLMCGDGTNDVGALRRAHVGISIISAPEIEARQRLASSKIKAELKRDRKERKKVKSLKQASGQSRSSLEKSLRQLQQAQEELDFVELGDASIASPFTSRTVSIKCCKDVLQHGRCTLVTMLQIYKILGVNSLVNAMVLSKLFLHGVKQGERQLTVLGIIVAALFFFVTRGKPLDTLSPIRPPSSVLCMQAIVSIAVQFCIHFSFIMLATEVALSFVDPFDPSMIPDGSFNPNTLNTCTFLMNALATINTFTVNYQGRPFMEDLRENKTFYRGLQVCYGVLFICAMEAFPPLNDLLQLSEYPIILEDAMWRSSSKASMGIVVGSLIGIVELLGLPVFMCGLMAADTLVCFAAERVVVNLFS